MSVNDSIPTDGQRSTDADPTADTDTDGVATVGPGERVAVLDEETFRAVRDVDANRDLDAEGRRAIALDRLLETTDSVTVRAPDGRSLAAALDD